MKRTARVVPLVAILLLAGATSTRPAAQTTDPITEWSVAASNAAAATTMAPLRTPITLAILHVAMYDAANAIAGDHAPYVAKLSVPHPADSYAAAVEAGYQVLVAEFPTQQATLQTTRDRLLAGVPQSAAKDGGITVGAAAARAILARRADDRRNAVISYSPGSGAGAWIPTPPAHLPATTAFLANVAPFTMASPTQFRPEGPPPLRSKKWTAEYNEVRALGARHSTSRTAGQTATALFWEPLAGTVWPATIRRLAREQSLDLVSSARFQAAAFAAFADGLIACWDAKFHFNFWRPVTAIHNASEDGNRATEPEAGWEPLAITPNFPEYPSGHACATAAVAYTIENFFDHQVHIPARNVVTGEERFYRKASDAVDEVVEARMLLGLHFRSADEDGAEIGWKIARQLQRKWFRRRD
jgi:hypothetical protein